jgi:hypothetical protein
MIIPDRVSRARSAETLQGRRAKTQNAKKYLIIILNYQFLILNSFSRFAL